MEALLLDRLACRVQTLPLKAAPPPEILVWCGRGFRRRRDREDPGKPHVKVYVEELTEIRSDTPASGYDLSEFG